MIKIFEQPSLLGNINFQIIVSTFKNSKKVYKTYLHHMLTLFRMGIFSATYGWGGGAKRYPLPTIFHTHPTVIKLGTDIHYLKKIPKIYKSRDTLLDVC